MRPGLIPRFNRHKQSLVGLLLFMLSIGFAPTVLAQRSIDEAVEELARELASQIGEQRVSSITIVQFSNLSGGQTQRERNLADKLARSISQKGNFRLIARVRAEAVVLQLGIPLGAEIYGETAARIGKGLGADAVITGSIESHGGGAVQLRAQAFSSQAGINIASAQSNATEGQPSKPNVIVRPAPEPIRPAPRAEPPPRSQPDRPPTNGIVRNAHGLRFEVRSCVISRSRTATCRMVVTSESQDRHLNLLGGGYTKLQDDTSESYPTKISYGQDALIGQPNSLLLADTPYEVTLLAENISTQASKIQAVVITRMDSSKFDGSNYRKIVLDFPHPPTVETLYTRVEPHPPAGPRESSGFVFEVQNCEASAERTLACHVKVTSRSISRKLTLLGGGHVLIQDDASLSYPTKISFGRHALGGQNSIVLVPDTPYDFTVMAENVSSQGSRVRAIWISRMDSSRADGSGYAAIKTVLAHPEMK